MKKFKELQMLTKDHSPWLLPIEMDQIHTLRRDYESVIEFVIICWVIGPDSSWRSTTAEIYEKIVEFLNKFASTTFHTGTKDPSYATSLFGYTKNRR